MHVPIIFATMEGQTRRIADFVAEELRRAGHEPELVDASDPGQSLTLGSATHVILAACVHERRHPQPFEVLVTAARGDLNSRKTLMISVSLKAAFADGQEEAQDYLTEMTMRTGLNPTARLLAAGAVRSAGYDYFHREVLRHVVLDGQDWDPDDGDREFTDWDSLRSAVAGFLTL